MGADVDKRFRYRQSNVHDIPVEGSFVRLWSTDGTAQARMIEKAFRPLLRTLFVYPYAALMPDYHPGEGSMIGSVIPTRDVVLPSVMGGDLGCGMTAVRLPVSASALSEKLRTILQTLRARIPVGTAFNAVVTQRVASNSIWERQVRAPVLTNRLRRKLLRQFGSLGGGNHFLEVQEDQHGRSWVMLHSGSRYLGVIIQEHYVEAGREQSGIDARLYSRIPFLQAGTQVAEDYLFDLTFAMDFARESRREMMLRALEALAEQSREVDQTGAASLLESATDIAHNYVAWEEHFGEKIFVHRKGATRALDGEIGLIPGSMGTRSYVVEGRGNEFSFCSCSHGAGRAMSRGDAFRKISDKGFRRSMESIVYVHDDRIRDEAPEAYKDIQHVGRAQKDLVKIRHELRPLVSIKGQ